MLALTFIITLKLLAAALMIKSTVSVKLCYFCADLESKCEENLKSATPQIMTCVDFLVNGEEPMKFFVHPFQLKSRPEPYIFAPGLAKRNAKTRCVELKFKYTPSVGEETVKPPPQISSNVTYTFRSCFYTDLAAFSDACEYLRRLFGDTQYVNEVECVNYCKKPLCNSEESADLGDLVTAAAAAAFIVKVLWDF